MKQFKDPKLEIMCLDVTDIVSASYEGDWAELDDDWDTLDE